MSRSPAPERFQPSTFSFSEENLSRAEVVIGYYPPGRKASAVLALLDLAQRQNDGWLPRAAMDAVAKYLDMPRIRVYEVATFYEMFNLAPIGEHHIRICTTTPCQLRGALDIVSRVENHLNVELGGTTNDGKFTVDEFECLGACVNAPVIWIDDDYYEDLDPDKAVAIIDALCRGEKPTSGPQINRLTSAPVSGARTLLKPVD
tara:strand:+ start:1921 stop:2529 length:609 start_codon:yes stop_codon:yes gene_type:complete